MTETFFRQPPLDPWSGPLCPFGLAGDEPLDAVDMAVMGVREGVWRGYVSIERGKVVYPQGDWSFANG